MGRKVFNLPVILVAVLALIILGGGVYYLTKSGSFSPQPYSGQSGISGKATLGPICPLEREGEKCNQPYQGEIVIRSANGKREITKFTTDLNGEFRVHLPPGKYTLVTISQNRLPFLKEQLVEVETNKYTEVDLTLDTGIR